MQADFNTVSYHRADYSECLLIRYGGTEDQYFACYRTGGGLWQIKGEPADDFLQEIFTRLKIEHAEFYDDQVRRVRELLKDTTDEIRREVGHILETLR